MYPCLSSQFHCCTPRSLPVRHTAPKHRHPRPHAWPMIPVDCQKKHGLCADIDYLLESDVVRVPDSGVVELSTSDLVLWELFRCCKGSQGEEGSPCKHYVRQCRFRRPEGVSCAVCHWFIYYSIWRVLIVLQPIQTHQNVQGGRWAYCLPNLADTVSTRLMGLGMTK